MAISNAASRGAANTEDLIRLPDGRIKKFVVAACRVKDGAQYLPRVLERISMFADEIVMLVSKLTTDNTKEICAQFPKVVLVEDDKDDVKGYAEAVSRNRLLEMAYSRHPDWIWCFDADEMPVSSIKEEIVQLTNPENPEVMLWTFPIMQLWNDDNTRRVDGLWGKFWQGRMFRALPGIHIEGGSSLIHCGSHPNFAQEHWGTSLVKIVHYGNVDPAGRAKKYERYTKIDTEKNLDMVLGQWKDYYWKLYYGDPAPAAEVQAFKASGQPWRTIADPADWSRPAYGTFFARDAYRHVNDERGAKFVPFSEKPRVSLCMLIHNEGELVARCIEGFLEYVDEIICVDTGCTDNTPNFARQLGAKVYPFKWTDNFSEARNFSLSLATGDWILRLDPDEQLPKESLPHLPLMIREANVEGWIFPIVNWLEDPAFVPNAQWALSETCRLFKNSYPRIKYAGIVHEELDDSFISLRKEREKAFIDAGHTQEEATAKGPFLDIRRAPCQLWHFGYLRGQAVLDAKFQYYYGLGNKQIEERPDDPRAWFTTGVHALHVGDYEEAINRYKKVLELNPKDHMAMNDAGVLLWTCGNMAQAEKYFRLALSVMGPDVHENHRQRVDKNLQTVRRTILSMMLFR
jgi:glycosyltransferase involved in cell wall biosynthesis